jgi:hypothetical protein
MSGPNYVLDKSFKLAAACTAFQLVKFSTDDATCAPFTAVTDELLGVVQDTVVAADVNRRVADVRLLGITYVVVGATPVVRGNRLKADATGKVVPSAADADFVVGRAMMSGAVGDRITMLITPAAQRGTA